MMTGQRVGKGSRSNITQTDLNIRTSSRDEHMRCRDRRHGGAVDLSRHLKIHDYLSRIGVPHFDIGIKGRCNEEPGVDGIPDGR